MDGENMVCVGYELPPDLNPCPECRTPGGERCPETCVIVRAVRELEDSCRPKGPACPWCTLSLASHEPDELAECCAHLAESEGGTDEERDELARATAADEAHDAAVEDDRSRLWA